MQDKLYVLLAYVLIGIIIALWPLCVRGKIGGQAGLPPPNPKQTVATFWMQVVLLSVGAIGILVITGESSSWIVLLSFGLIALISGGLDAIAILTIFLSLCISATLPWWERQGGSLDISSLKFFILGFFIFIFIHIFTKVTKESRVGKNNGIFSIAWILIYILFATILTFSTGIFADSNAFLTLWHHWGAYIGPSELLMSGATLFYDFPAQYGLGPTALIAGFCANDCWSGMYFIAGFATLAFSVLIAILALTINNYRWPERLVVLLLCLVTCFFWTAYPPSVSSPMMTPSVSGLRFLPALVLMTYLFFSPSIEYSKPRMFIAHGLWMLGALWSPESAFYVTFVWWPYYLFIQRIEGGCLLRLKGFANSLMKLLLVSLGLVILFNIVFRIIYNEAPTLYGFLAYAINPPGPMPINLHGAIWYFFLATIIGVSVLLNLWLRVGDSISFRRGFLIQLLSYSVFSYFLGRSHDNNLLNIMPLVLLVLLHGISATDSKILSKASIVLSAALFGWLPLFGWQSWNANISEGRVFTFHPKLLSDSMSFSNPNTASNITERFSRGGLNTGSASDAGHAIDFLRQNYGEPITVLDYSLDLVRSTPSAAWSAIHGPANFTYIPSQRRREFLYRTAGALKRAGWLLVDKKFSADEWLADFDFAYDRTNRLEFGTYYAIRFSPRAQP